MNFPVGRSLFYAATLVLVTLVGVALLMAWALRSPVGSGAVLGGLLLQSLAAAGVAWHWLNGPCGTLSWRADGQWHWKPVASAPEVLLSIDCSLDLQNRMLLRATRATPERWHRPLWLWVEAHRSQVDWVALRRAVVASGAVAPAPGVGAQPGRGEGAA